MYAVERREKLIRTLVLRGHATVSELAMEFEVSERTILRDIETLSTSTPIYTVSGRGGFEHCFVTDKMARKEPANQLCRLGMAEREGFEPSCACAQTDFESAPL